jgi:rRNA-processing protein FCF1
LRKVLFDSSFLMSVSENPTEWEADIASLVGGFEPVLLDCVKGELVTISAGSGKKARLAKIALQLAADFSPGPCGRAKVDDEIVSTALGCGAAVATADRALSATLRAVHLDVVGLSSGRVRLV